MISINDLRRLTRKSRSKRHKDDIQRVMLRLNDLIETYAKHGYYSTGAFGKFDSVFDGVMDFEHTTQILERYYTQKGFKVTRSDRYINISWEDK